MLVITWRYCGALLATDLVIPEEQSTDSTKLHCYKGTEGEKKKRKKQQQLYRGGAKSLGLSIVAGEIGRNDVEIFFLNK